MSDMTVNIGGISVAQYRQIDRVSPMRTTNGTTKKMLPGSSMQAHSAGIAKMARASSECR
ncbi:hypothetical protein XH88_35145 [Bradyrhizobium sp. CCBAU 51627]|nr:hypothetical protein [Bradyrhizobium sp. CCBAU 51627]